MAFETPHIIVAVILVALSALYMLELSPHTDDGIVELRQTQVLLISQCDRVFSHIGDVSKYPTWFPGIRNITAERPGPMESGKKFEEFTEYPIIGDIGRPIVVTSYVHGRRVQWMYHDWSRIVITVKVSQPKPDRCLVDYNIGTRCTSWLYHLFYGVPMRIMYSLKGRHAMFAVRSMFNDNGQTQF